MSLLRLALLAAGAAVAWPLGLPSVSVETDAAGAASACASHACGCPTDGCAGNCCCAGDPAEARPAVPGEARLAHGSCHGAQPDDEAAAPAPIALMPAPSGASAGALPPATLPDTASPFGRGHVRTPAHGPPRGIRSVSAA